MPDLSSSGLVEFASALIQRPSVLGGEGAVAEAVVEEMERLGYSEAGIDEIGNAVGVIEGVEPGPTILFDAHMDTVDVVPRGAWSVDPFAGAVGSGRLWGRGASDMKGSLAAMVHGIATLDRDGLPGRVVVVGSVEEERIEGAALAPVCERFAPDTVVIGEASDLRLVRAGRGRAELVFETAGRPAHASTPDQGLSAVTLMMDVVREIESIPGATHPFVGRGVTCLTDIISVPYPAHSVVPSGCRATIERRLVPGETFEGVVEELHGACADAGAADCRIELARAELHTWTGYPLDRSKWLAPWELPQDHPVVAAGLDALGTAGIEASLGSYQFCTNAAYTAGEARIPTLGFGPGREDLAHIVDEWVSVAQLESAGRGYRALAEALTAL